MKLSDHFTLAELTRSDLALRRGIPNEPTAAVVAELTRLCRDLLEPARSLLGVPLHINSGYRSPVLNSAVGGAKHSAHLAGRAADIVPVGLPLREAFDTLRRSALPFDQIIIECGAWLHIALPVAGKPPRREMLTASGSPGHWRYEAVA